MTEVPGLQFALARPPVELTLELRRIQGQYISARLLFPDEVSALTLKAFATTVRMKATDVIDVWRCLEICFAAGIDAAAFGHGTAAEAAAIIKQLFDHQSGHGMRTLAGQQRLNRDAANQRYTRIRSLRACSRPPKYRLRSLRIWSSLDRNSEAILTSTMSIDLNSPTALYEQVAAELRRDIATGEAKPGERMPLAKDLAAVLGVNKNTVLRALRQLRDEGLLEFRRGRGITVAGTPQRGAVVSKVRELVAYARQQGYGPDELVVMIRAVS